MAAVLDDDAEVVTPYGATESLPVATISSKVVLTETGAQTDAGAGTCVGHPVRQTEVCIIGIDDEPIATFSPALTLPRGEIGEICVKGPVVTRTYFNRDHSTALAKMMDPAGGFWHRMGDVGYLDGEGRLWFCGRKSQRVITTDGVLFTEPCEAVFNVHPAVKRTALTGVPAGAGMQRPVVCVELEAGCPRREHAAVLGALREIAGQHGHTRGIAAFVVHPGFPVDIRHNAKIDRAALGEWAAARV